MGPLGPCEASGLSLSTTGNIHSLAWAGGWPVYLAHSPARKQHRNTFLGILTVNNT